MMMRGNTMKDKSRLAKLLAEEDIHVVHKPVETAAFDVKNRELVLPIWKDMTESVQDMMTLHEVGHALWTPLKMLEDAKKKKIKFSFVNVLEDVRIDKMIKNRYPGGVRSYNLAYKDLQNRDFFGTHGKDLKSFNLIDRINLHYKGYSDVPFSDEEMVWVQKANETKTPTQVLKLAQELYDYIDENEESQGQDTNPQNPAGNQKGNDNITESNSGNSGDEKGDESQDSEGSSEDAKEGDSDDQGSAGDDQKDDQTEGESQSSSGSDDKDTEGQEEKPKTTNGKEGGKSEGDFEATTDNTYAQNSKKFLDKTAKDRVYAWIPKLENIDDMIVSPKEILGDMRDHYQNETHDKYYQSNLDEIKTFLDKSKKTVSYVTKEFEMKKAADQYNRATVAKTGSLDMSKLHTYKYNEDLFAKVTNLPGATNHGLVFFLDWSGSMQENMTGTMMQLFNLTEFCMRTKIPFEVYAFSDRSVNRYGDWKQKFKSGDLMIQDCRLFNFLSSSMSKKDQVEMMHYMIMMGNYWKGYRNWRTGGYPISVHNKYQLGGTPLNHAIVAAMKIVPDFQMKHSLQKVHSVFLTDGYSHRIDGAMTVGTDRDGKDYNGVRGVCNGYTHDIYITDPITNNKVEIKDMKYSRNAQTLSLFKLLKKRVPNMNIVGFFIAGSGRKGNVHKNVLADKFDLCQYNDYNKIKELYKVLKKENVVVAKDEGYDEFYILPGAGAMDENEELVVEGKVTQATLKRAFMKSSSNKMTNRPVLNKFVGMIA